MSYFCIMDISSDIEIISSILQKVKNPSIRASIQNLLARLKKNGVSESENISVEQYNKEIELSEKEYDRGEYVSTKKIKEGIREWQKSNIK